MTDQLIREIARVTKDGDVTIRDDASIEELRKVICDLLRGYPGMLEVVEAAKKGTAADLAACRAELAEVTEDLAKTKAELDAVISEIKAGEQVVSTMTDAIQMVRDLKADLYLEGQIIRQVGQNLDAEIKKTTRLQQEVSAHLEFRRECIETTRNAIEGNYTLQGHLDACAADLAAVTAERDRLAKACVIYRRVAESAQAQWGEDYLWEKWGHDEDMKAALAELEKP